MTIFVTTFQVSISISLSNRTTTINQKCSQHASLRGNRSTVTICGEDVLQIHTPCIHFVVTDVKEMRQGMVLHPWCPNLQTSEWPALRRPFILICQDSILRFIVNICKQWWWRNWPCRCYDDDSICEERGVIYWAGE